MGIQTVFLAALSFAAVVVAVFLAITLWQIKKSMEQLSRRTDESLRQLEMTAEDLRKTNAVFRSILVQAERSAENVAHVTEGVRKFRKTFDAATAVMSFAVVPVLENMAGGLAGAKAAISHVVNRFVRKESGHV